MWKIITGDNRRVLPTLPRNLVQCVVTSPPYFRQRDYGNPGQIGLESTPEEYIAEMVGVFRLVRDVLRDDGVLWLNLGDKYGTGSSGQNLSAASGSTLRVGTVDGEYGHIKTDPIPGFEKQLLGIPWRVALAMQADGWVLRCEVIWYKTNAMPSSAHDRPGMAHEQVFLFSKNTRYFYDDLAIPAVNTTRRSVWPIAVACEKEAHFAVFPDELATTCILHGTSSMGACPVCHAPTLRLVERERTATRPGADTKVVGDSEREGNRDPLRHTTVARTVGWEVCKQHPRIELMGVSCVVLDPFAGSSTTIRAAISRGRSGIGIELNPEYAAIGDRKCRAAESVAGFGF